MRWHRTKSDPSDEHRAEATKALRKAKRDFETASERDEEINSVAEEAKHYGRRNNFTTLIRQALQGTGH